MNRSVRLFHRGRRLPGRVLSLSLAGALLVSAVAAGAQDLVPAGATWTFLDDGSDQGTAWRAPAFDDSGWSSGPAQLGYGDGDEATEVEFGPDAGNKFVTTYFRHAFDVTDPASIGELTLELVRDDGAVVYLNGTEVARSNMTGGTITSATVASMALGGADESAWIPFQVDSALLAAGTNVIAVEIHQANGASSDISFDLRLSETVFDVTRGPYLQKGSPSSVTVKWSTNLPATSVVRFGTVEGALDQSVSSSAEVTDHEVTLADLAPDTRYYYSVGDDAGAIAGGTADHFFDTHPVAGTAQATRIWVLGDSGTADANAAAVRDAWLTFNGGDHADVWLMLGDNAYNNGTQSEYQAAVFDMYPTVLRNSVLWSTLGNHDGYTASVYYDIFTLPTQGEAGGTPSGTEAWYSFDYANIHFVCLDSYGSDRGGDSDMARWLVQDLANTTQEWIVAFWHHPPYSKGSHNSDTETQLVEMRRNFLPILDAHGVDLVLGGHSHSYERSTLIDGHYGTSGSFDAATMEIDGGTGDPAGDGAYVKEPVSHAGAVYTVAGSSGKISGGALDHPVMITNLNELGSLVIDVDGNVMDVRFLNDTAAVRDHFRIVHDPGATEPPAAPAGLAATAVSQTEIELTWTDSATDETGFTLERSLDQSAWAAIADLPAGTEAFTDTALTDSTVYYYRVRAYNGFAPSAWSDVASAETLAPDPFVISVASGEATISGTVSGTFADTHAAGDGAVESIEEVESGGKPSRRHSLLEHTWSFQVPAGVSATLHASAWKGSGGEGEDFLFAFSADGGASWFELFTVTGTAPPAEPVALLLPSAGGGEVLVRVTDLDRTERLNLPDTVLVDELVIETATTGEGGDPPPAPSGLAATKIDSQSIALAWSDNSSDELGFEVERSLQGSGTWELAGTLGVDEATFTDSGLAAASTYAFRVRAFNASGASAWSNTAAATTDPAPAGPVLVADGFKAKGFITVDLAWTGATADGPVTVERNGVVVSDTADSSGGEGTFRDETGQKGSGTFLYRIVDAAGVPSNEVTVVF